MRFSLILHHKAFLGWWLRAKILTCYFNFCGELNISSWRARSVHVPVPYAQDHHVLKGPFQIWNFYAYAEHTHMLWVRINSWCLCSANASVLDRYAQSTHKLLMCMLWRDFFKFGIFTLMLSSGYASVPDVYAQETHQFLTRMLTMFLRDCALGTH